MADEVVVYFPGIFCCSVCAPDDMTPEKIVEEVNRINPTNISSDWGISKDDKFRTGEPNPCPCDTDGNRKHYLLEC